MCFGTMIGCEATPALGQSGHFEGLPTTSGLPLETDIVGAGRHVSKVPKPEVANRCASGRCLHPLRQLCIQVWQQNNAILIASG
jgi:hypothetical protein